jgi:hypothetical protein
VILQGIQAEKDAQAEAAAQQAQAAAGPAAPGQEPVENPMAAVAALFEPTA